MKGLVPVVCLIEKDAKPGVVYLLYTLQHYTLQHTLTRQNVAMRVQFIHTDSPATTPRNANDIIENNRNE